MRRGILFPSSLGRDWCGHLFFLYLLFFSSHCKEELQLILSLKTTFGPRFSWWLGLLYLQGGEQILSITNYQRNANQNDNEVLPPQVTIAIIKKSTNNIYLRGYGEKGTLIHCRWECKLVQPLWRTAWRFIKKLKIELSSDPEISLLGIYPEKNTVQKDNCIPVFIAVLFTIAKTWKQPECPLTEEWIKKMWYIYTMEYYSAIRKNEIMPFVAA